MKRRRRTIIAAIALAVAVLLPTTAWYLTGSGEARRRARLLEQTEVDGLQHRIRRDADRLATRLEGLRTGEERRPFYHYQSITHDPAGAAEGLAVAPSPLSQGVSDPLVWAHFQIDETGLVTVPMVNERFPELTSDESFTRFCSLLTELQNAVAIGLENARDVDGGYFEGSLLELPRSEWEQIRDADQVYAAITGRGEHPPRRLDARPGTVVIRIGPLEWRTVVFDSGPILTALREVETPLGIRLQGFTIAPTGIAHWLGDDGETREGFIPTSMLPSDRISSMVGNTGWWLAADPAPLVARARAEGRVAIAQFLSVFALGSAAILVAAVAVMLIFIQTDRLAYQRARFAASAAHELKTPLASLRLHSEMLSEGFAKPERTAVYASRIAAESGRLGRVVSNMLDIARLERGAQIADPRPGDAGDAVRRCLERLLPNLEGAGLRVEVVCESELPTVMFDFDALCQILDNLLDNAEKYTREQDDRLATVEVRATDDGVRITVADNGPGIRGIGARALFEPYRRPANDGAPAGLGLGLALARSLAHAQGGDLELGEAKDAGAAFVLTLARG